MPIVIFLLQSSPQSTSWWWSRSVNGRSGEGSPIDRHKENVDQPTLPGVPYDTSLPTTEVTYCRCKNTIKFKHKWKHKYKYKHCPAFLRTPRCQLLRWPDASADSDSDWDNVHNQHNCHNHHDDNQVPFDQRPVQQPWQPTLGRSNEQVISFNEKKCFIISCFDYDHHNHYNHHNHTHTGALQWTGDLIQWKEMLDLVSSSKYCKYMLVNVDISSHQRFLSADYADGVSAPRVSSSGRLITIS